MKKVECVGRTVEEATEAALKQLGVSRDKAEILILDEGSRGILGLGAKMARVRVSTSETAAAAAPLSAKSSATLSAKSSATLSAKSSATLSAKSSATLSAKSSATLSAKPPVQLSAPASVATNFLNRVAALMGLPEPTVEIREEGDTLQIMVDGENVGPMIGHHGDALDALQLLTGLVVNPQGHDSEQYYHVTLDVSHYRARREETLIRLATRLAEKAEETGERQELEPMNSYERRIIHTALAEFSGIVTWSEGEDPYRHVIIAVEGMEDTGADGESEEEAVEEEGLEEE